MDYTIGPGFKDLRLKLLPVEYISHHGLCPQLPDRVNVPGASGHPHDVMSGPDKGGHHQPSNRSGCPSYKYTHNNYLRFLGS
ncbi:hypothetical protein J22TS3_38350 [Paenibacillus sp. J22TS3]|nr:hypothetical protein J22TS3_38350 [Paenibacillus sp. J22TS3]